MGAEEDLTLLRQPLQLSSSRACQPEFQKGSSNTYDSKSVRLHVEENYQIFNFHCRRVASPCRWNLN